ncbi:hypothetical protein F7U66_01680 [Vibrio parahaemolyticus]|nr:hypothetical protein [Vibrio parahaemolyticus]
MKYEMKDLLGGVEVTTKSELVCWRSDHSNFQAAKDCIGVYETPALDILSDFESCSSLYGELTSVIDVLEDVVFPFDIYVGMVFEYGDQGVFISREVIDVFLKQFDERSHYQLVNFALNVIQDESLRTQMFSAQTEVHNGSLISFFAP